MKKSNYRKWWLLPLGMVVCLAGMAQNRLPRANSEARENVISLSGEWQFQRDDQRAGKNGITGHRSTIRLCCPLQ